MDLAMREHNISLVLSVAEAHTNRSLYSFTVLPTLWSAKRLQAYPSYSDRDLDTEKVIKPVSERTLEAIATDCVALPDDC